MAIRDSLKRLWRETTKRKYYARIDDDRVLDETFIAGPIEPREAYFQITLSEMFLRDATEYGRDFAPLGILEASFIYDGETKDFPFFVGIELLRGVQKYVEGERVEYKNTKIVGPTPYCGGNVDLFVGLFRTQVGSLAKSLFHVVERILGKFDVASLSQYAGIAGVLGEGLGEVLGMDEVECRLAVRDSFGDHQDAARQFRNSYLAYVNCPEQDLAANTLWVRDGRLCHGSDRGSLTPLVEHDYCLVRIQALKNRSDYTALPFHGTWRNAREKLIDGNHTLARGLFTECCQQIAVSPDLTAKHATSLMQGYHANFLTELELHSGWQAAERRGAPTRGKEQARNPRLEISQMVSAAEHLGMTKDVLMAMVDLGENWDRVPYVHDRGVDFELTDRVLNEQLTAIEKFRPQTEINPQAVADAITNGTLAAAAADLLV